MEPARYLGRFKLVCRWIPIRLRTAFLQVNIDEELSKQREASDEVLEISAISG
jgi:hypothetical protein